MAPSKPKSAPKAPPLKADKAPKSGAKAAPGKHKTDWEAVERDYRTGKYTLRELGGKHGADPSLISRKAKKNGWTQDLAIAIKQATNAKLTEQLVHKEVHKGQQKVHNTIEAAATMGANVIMGHRKGLSELAGVKQLLLDQIKSAAENLPDLTEIIELARKPDDHGNDRVNDALKRAMSRSTLADDLKKLADVDEKVRKGEREAFNLDDDGKKDADALTALLHGIANAGNSAFKPVARDPEYGD